MRRAIFLDRDGVISKIILKNGQPFGPRKFEHFELLEGRKEVLEEFKSRGFLIIVITNQPDIARGLLEKSTLERMHKLIKDNLPIDDVFVCWHDDRDACSCRKPKPGMLLKAAKKWDINLRESFFIGDQWKDAEAGRNAGCKTILLDYPYNKGVESDFRVNDFKAVLSFLPKEDRSS